MASAELSRRAEKVAGLPEGEHDRTQPDRDREADGRLARLTTVRTSPRSPRTPRGRRSSRCSRAWRPPGRPGGAFAGTQASQPSCARRSRRGRSWRCGRRSRRRGKEGWPSAWGYPVPSAANIGWASPKTISCGTSGTRHFQSWTIFSVRVPRAAARGRQLRGSAREVARGDPEGGAEPAEAARHMTGRL